MLCSIIIPMYNLEKYIIGTLETILKNDLRDCELILIDDASTDATIMLVEQYLEENAKCEYSVIKKGKTGVSDTRNQGIEVSKGEYLLFCDGDDLVTADMLEKIRKEYHEKYDMVAWPFYIIDGINTNLSQKQTDNAIFNAEEMLRLYFFEGYRMRLGSFAVRKELLIENQLYFTTNCTFAEDVEFIIKCIVNAAKICWISIPLYYYVKHKGSLIYSYNLRRFEAPRAIGRIDKYLTEKKANISMEIKEYIKNELYVLHYIYSLEGCLANIHSYKEGCQLYKEIRERYSDVLNNYRKKLFRMKHIPTNISAKRIALLKLGTFIYIQVYLQKRDKI